MDAELKDLPHDREWLAAMIRSLLLEGEQQKQRAEQQTRRAEELYLQNLRLQLELERYKKWYYGREPIGWLPAERWRKRCWNLPSN